MSQGRSGCSATRCASPAIRRLPIAFGWLTKRPLEKQAYDAYLRPGQTNPGVRRDSAKVLRAIRRRYTIQADAALANFDRPTLIAWATEDRVFPYSHAERLAQILPERAACPDRRLLHLHPRRPTRGLGSDTSTGLSGESSSPRRTPAFPQALDQRVPLGRRLSQERLSLRFATGLRGAMTKV